MYPDEDNRRARSYIGRKRREPSLALVHRGRLRPIGAKVRRWAPDPPIAASVGCLRDACVACRPRFFRGRPRSLAGARGLRWHIRLGHAGTRADTGRSDGVAYQVFDVQVPGGQLRVGRWGTGPAVVIAAHGLTGTHMNFEALADQLGDTVTLLAPDLRGRGRSTVNGPYGMARHADDLMAVLDHAGCADASVVGHSRGGFVAVVAAGRHPGRIRDLVLVEGGLPLDLGSLAGRPIEEVVRAVVGPALDRLRMTFPSRQAYLDYWRPHPALAGDWNDY